MSLPNQQTQTIDQLVKIYNELKVLEHAYRTQKISFFVPIGKQGAASMALNDGPNVVLIFGSNRSGKTAWGAVEACAHAYGRRPWLPESDPNHIVRLANNEPIPVPNIGRIIAQNYNQAMDQTIRPKIEEWFPKGFFEIKKNNQGLPTKIVCSNGSVIYLMSNDQDDMAFEGPAGHWVWADEPIDYSKYVGLKRGLVDYSGHMWLTCTPLNQAWMSEILVDRADEVDPETGRIGVRFFHFDIWDNCVDSGGHLRREDILSFHSDLREDEKEARVHGRPMWQAGRVYKEWSPEEPYWIPPHRIPATWPRVCVIDPHPRKPIAVLWAAITPDNQKIVYRDLFDPKLHTVTQVASRIKELEGWSWSESKKKWLRGEFAEPIVTRIIDTSAEEQERTAGTTIRNKFMEEGIHCMLAKKRNAASGYDAIHDALEIKNEWSEPDLIVFNCCHHVKKNFLNFVWDDWSTGKQQDKMGDRQEVRKTQDDFIDCIRYIYQYRLSYHTMRRDMNYGAEESNGISLDTRSHMQGPMTRKERAEWQRSSKSKPRRESKPRGTELYSSITPTTLRRRTTPS